VPLTKDKGMRALLNMDKDFKKLMEKVITNAFKIAVGNKGARGGSKSNQFILKNFQKRWETQRTYAPLSQETENRKTDRGEDFILVSSGELMRSVRDTIRVKLSGTKVTAKVTVPDYGVFTQEGTIHTPPRVFFTLDGVEKEFMSLIENLLTLEFNKLGIRSKEN